MSRAMALVQFRDRSVYNACYNGTSDILSPWLISDKKLNTQYNGSRFSFNDDNFKNYKERYIDQDIIKDSEPVRIFIDYGHGWMWDGMASKSKLYVTSPLAFDNNESIDEIDLWVYEYHINHRMDTRYIENRIRDPLFKKEKYKVGDLVYFVATVNEIIWHPGMFKTGSPEKPIPKKIIRIDYTNNGIMYQVKGCHFDERMIETVVFNTYEAAVDGLKRRYEEGSNWNGLGNKW